MLDKGEVGDALDHGCRRRARGAAGIGGRRQLEQQWRLAAQYCGGSRPSHQRRSECGADRGNRGRYLLRRGVEHAGKEAGLGGNGGGRGVERDLRENRMDQGAEAFAARAIGRARRALDFDLRRLRHRGRCGAKRQFGRASNAERRGGSGCDDFLAPQSPDFVFAIAAIRSFLPFAGLEQLRLPEAHGFARVELQDGRIPPDHMMRSCLRAV